MPRFIATFLCMTWATSVISGAHTDSVQELCTTIIESGLDIPADCANISSNDLETSQDHIFFDTNVQLTDAAMRQMDLLKLVMQTSAMSKACYRLVGHSDASGDAGVNLVISRQRAEVVAKYLQTEPNAVNSSIEFVGLGEAEPLVGLDPNDKKNRRVAIFAKQCS